MHLLLQLIDICLLGSLVIHIIALTAYALIGVREKLLEAGCEEYISKPMTKKELFEKLKLFIHYLKKIPAFWK